MGIRNMMTYDLRLECQPGGVIPGLHLKKGTGSTYLVILIPRDDILVSAEFKRCVLKAFLPNGTDLFISGFTGVTDHMISVEISNGNVKRMAEAAGTYKCTLTILNTSNTVTRSTYMNFDLLTVLPFNVFVHERA